MNDNRSNFEGVGERIAQRLNELKLSQKDVYSVTGFSKTTMSNYVNGKRLPNTSELYQLAKFLDVSMEWLLTGNDITTNENHSSDQSSKINYNFQFSPEDIELLAKIRQLTEREQGRIEERIEMVLSARNTTDSSSKPESPASKNGKGREDAATRTA